MNPAFLDEMSWEMAEVYGAISDRILINLAKYFPYFTEANLPASSFAYQAQMLAQMGKVNSETVQIIKNGLKDGDTVLKSVLEQAIISSVKANQPELLQAVRKGILTPPGFLPPVLTPNQMRAFNLYYKQSADGLNLVNTVMLESTRQAYQSTVSDIANRVQVTQTVLDIGAGETITGVSSWNSAMQHSIKRMKDNGITGFIDHAGRRWSAEAYTAMDIRTTVYNTARAAVWEQNEKFGNDLYQVSSHAGARPLCYPWQCKVISSLDASRTVVDLDGNEVYVYAQSETSYGQPAGLFGINCKHYPTPFIPGVSKVREVPQDAEQNAKTYAESQKQRGLERKLREEKRDLDMLKAQNAPEEVIAAQRDKCRKTSADIDEFCQETGRARHREREAVYTQRSFPSRFEYDPAQFVNEQKDVIDNWFTSGGSQQRFTAGQMIPVKPILPNPVQTPPVNVAPQATTPQQPQTLNDTLADAYENHRVSNGLTSVPYDPESPFPVVHEDVKLLGNESQETLRTTISDLTGKYDTPLTDIHTMDKYEAIGRRDAFAYVSHNYGNDTAAMVINPVKCKNEGELVERLKTLRGVGYCANVPDAMLPRYVYTHEFGHTLISMNDLLRDSGNFVGANYEKIRQVRKEVSSVFDEYRATIKHYEDIKRSAEKRFMLGLDTQAGEEARTAIQYLKANRISVYSLTNADEFFAESFVYTEYGGTDNIWANKVRKIIDAHFLR